jgi:hypothetical protein
MERRGRFELTRKHVHLAAVTQSNHKLTERSGLADQFEVSLG